MHQSLGRARLMKAAGIGKMAHQSRKKLNTYTYICIYNSKKNSSGNPFWHKIGKESWLWLIALAWVALAFALNGFGNALTHAWGCQNLHPEHETSARTNQIEVATTCHFKIMIKSDQPTFGYEMDMRSIHSSEMDMPHPGPTLAHDLTVGRAGCGSMSGSWNHGEWDRIFNICW